MAYQKQTPEAWAQQLNFAGLEARYGLPKGLLTEVCRQESAGDPNAGSPKGACGLFQFMPGTSSDFGINPYDPVQSAEAAAKYLSQNLSKHGSDVAKALASYNWGPGNVQKAVAKYGDDWLAHAPKETKDYVANISGRMRGEMFWRPASEMPRATRSFEEVEADNAKSADADTNWLKQMASGLMDGIGGFGAILMMVLVAMGARQADAQATAQQTPATPNTNTPPEQPPRGDDTRAQEQARNVAIPNGCAVSTGVCLADAVTTPNVPTLPGSSLNLGG